MYCFVDESGNTGQHLFDENQPVLYYGLLTSKSNLDVSAEPLLRTLRQKLGVDRLHANQLGVAKLSEVAPAIEQFSKRKDVRFSLFKVNKPDHAVISFFDQVFDSGINDAVPWQHYWTPLRYAMLFKVAYLFDQDLAKSAWETRQQRDPAKCASQLQDICRELLSRVPWLPDERSRDLVGGALKWAMANPFEIDFGVSNKDTALQISPNLVGFQQVLQYVAVNSHRQSRQVRAIVVDRQTQFNKAQDELADVYRRLKGHDGKMGVGMPEFNWSSMPDVPPQFVAGDESAGLEFVDVALWIAKRFEEEKPLSNELVSLFQVLAKRGITDEVSLEGLDRRWRHLAAEPATNVPINEEVERIFERNEQARLEALKGL